MSEEQTALNDVLNKKAKETETAEEKEEPAPAEQVEEQKPTEEQKQEEDKEADAEEKDVQQKETAEPAPEKPQETEKKEAPKAKKALAENIVLVGKKPTMSYVLAAVTQFSDGIKEIHIKARGRSISRAVDVAEVVKNRFVQDLKTDVQIGTQEVVDDNNNKINVSTIDIILNK